MNLKAHSPTVSSVKVLISESEFDFLAIFKVENEGLGSISALGSASGVIFLVALMLLQEATDPADTRRRSQIPPVQDADEPNPEAMDRVESLITSINF